MPRQLEAMKDVVICDKSRGVDNKRYILEFPNGATRHLVSSLSEYIAKRSELGELKHLSTQRKRNQPRFRK